MDQQQARARFAARPVARLATVRPDGRPHLVPVTVAVLEHGGNDVIVFAVDHKPKRTVSLQRLANIAVSPRVAFLADHYADDWSTLWWVRADAVAEILAGQADPSAAGADHHTADADLHIAGADLRAEADPRAAEAIDALVRRYPQYRARPPAGPVVWSTVTCWSGWQAAR